MTKQALGRGLKALIPDTPRARTGLVEIPVDRIDAIELRGQMDLVI